MEEIKLRISSSSNVINRYRSGTSATGFHETDIDFLYFQLRKIIELILFASVSAQLSQSTKLKREAEKEWHAGKLFAWIEAVNPKFFPEPKRDVVVTENWRKLEKVADGFMTKDEMKRIYKKACGKFAHASRGNLYGNELSRKKHFDEIEGYLAGIRKLLGHHWVYVDEKNSFAVLMQTNEDGGVFVGNMVVVDD